MSSGRLSLQPSSAPAVTIAAGGLANQWSRTFRLGISTCLLPYIFLAHHLPRWSERSMHCTPSPTAVQLSTGMLSYI